ncbi:MAG: response regulator [Pseudobdellovibrionaceae bacterium]|nr:response regulator [Bdellovibrionales bacterium]USN48862.1 MAG: response regulator [Pseudobdellovibrionaceae bacterium]
MSKKTPNPKMRVEKIKVLVADDDRQMGRRLTSELRSNDFAAEFVDNGLDAKQMILAWYPRIVLIDLMLRDGNAFQVLKFIKSQPALNHHKVDVCVLSGHNDHDNVRRAFQLGAKDYVVKPITIDELIARLVFIARDHRHIEKIMAPDSPSEEGTATKKKGPNYWLQLSDLLLTQGLSQTDIIERLFNLTRMTAIKVGGVRCSVVRFVDQNSGVVIASSDDRSVSGLNLDLNRYPEIRLVVNTNSMVAVENITKHRQLKYIQQHFEKINFNSLIVAPIMHKDQVFGVLSVRMPTKKTTLTDNEILFVEVVAKVISLTLNGEDTSALEKIIRAA